MKKFFAIAALFVLLGIAGHCDYQDAVVAEMKNNGAYWRLSEQHPKASDEELIKLYEEQEALGDESEQCPD